MDIKPILELQKKHTNLENECQRFYELILNWCHGNKEVLLCEISNEWLKQSYKLIHDKILHLLQAGFDKGDQSN